MGQVSLAAGPEAERLVEAFSSTRTELVRALAGLLGSAEDAQDVVQEAFLKCWRRRDQTEEVRDLKAWIFRVGLNAARDLQRNVWRQRARPLPDIEPAAPHSGLSPGDALLHGELLDRFRTAVARLRPEERDVFLLRHRRELTYDQIADLRGLPVGTVKTRMRAALGKLRQQLSAICSPRSAAC
jgi:RNA polymerase sigma-70 factor (ECF subfamily)